MHVQIVPAIFPYLLCHLHINASVKHYSNCKIALTVLDIKPNSSFVIFVKISKYDKIRMFSTSTRSHPEVVSDMSCHPEL